MIVKAQDWRQNGLSIRDEMHASYRKIGEELKKTLGPRLRTALEALPADETLLYNALRDHAGGDSAALIEYLRSDRPLQREWLADTLDGVFDPPQGRPRDRDLRAAAMLAHFFYNRWKDANKRDGVNDRGFSALMKDDACRYALELEPHLHADFESVRQLLDRPVHRRK
jgi:hypothetical protein